MREIWHMHEVPAIYSSTFSNIMIDFPQNPEKFRAVFKMHVITGYFKRMVNRNKYLHEHWKSLNQLSFVTTSKEWTKSTKKVYLLILLNQNDLNASFLA